jgi:hypothetical protein
MEMKCPLISTNYGTPKSNRKSSTLLKYSAVSPKKPTSRTSTAARLKYSTHGSPIARNRTTSSNCTQAAARPSSDSYIAQSIINETGEPVVFMCPNNHLVAQTLKKAAEYNIPAVGYEKPFPDDFVNGKAVMVCNYSHLFNGMSRFTRSPTSYADQRVVPFRVRVGRLRRFNG